MNIKPFEEKVLASGLCDIMLPMDFVGVNEDKSYRYDANGYRSVKEISPGDFDLVLEILEKTISNLGKAGEFLLDPGKILLNSGTVYQNPRCRDIKIAYVPEGSGSTMTNLLRFIGDLAAGLEGEDRERLLKAKDFIEENNLSLGDAANHISEIRRFDKHM